jgi:hypothetical protein
MLNGVVVKKRCFLFVWELVSFILIALAISLINIGAEMAISSSKGEVI